MAGVQGVKQEVMGPVDSSDDLNGSEAEHEKTGESARVLGTARQLNSMGTMEVDETPPVEVQPKEALKREEIEKLKEKFVQQLRRVVHLGARGPYYNTVVKCLKTISEHRRGLRTLEQGLSAMKILCRALSAAARGGTIQRRSRQARRRWSPSG